MMKVVIISGPSGSGKTFLANILSNELKECITISTDSYYKDGFWVDIISRKLISFHDRIISLKQKLLIKNLERIINKDNNYIEYKYDYINNRRYIESKKYIDTSKISTIIIEGIFAHRLPKYILKLSNFKFHCDESKQECIKRRINRDIKYRGRNKTNIIRKSVIAWDLYQINSHRYLQEEQIIKIRTSDKNKIYQAINLIKEKPMT